ncbi:MAG TPA: glycosyl hydrolase, partial [Cytophagales bacterium]|nr:glycosyl hydrolase [Cytophagales bacterium]
MVLLVATDKGLMVYQLSGSEWSLQDIHFLGMPVGTVHVAESGTWWVGINHKHWGTKLHRSGDQGKTWEEATPPRFPEEQQTAVKALWLIESVGERLYVGVEPAALFVSEDGGQSFRLLEGLSGHGTRSRWMGGGKGSKDPFVHTLLIDPQDSQHLTTGISVAGVFQSYDGGASWEPTNEGLIANFLPNPTTQIGQDP